MATPQILRKHNGSPRYKMKYSWDYTKMLRILKVGIPVQSSNTYPEVEYIHIRMGCVEVKMANTADAAAVVVVVVLVKKSRIDSST